MSVPKSFLLGSEKEPPAEVDRLLGLQDLRRKNDQCEHVVIVGQPGPAALAVKMRGPDLCPHCTRREAAYWRVRAKTAEGSDRRLTKADEAGRGLAAALGRALARVKDLGYEMPVEDVATSLAEARRLGWL